MESYMSALTFKEVYLCFIIIQKYYFSIFERNLEICNYSIDYHLYVFEGCPMADGGKLV